MLERELTAKERLRKLHHETQNVVIESTETLSPADLCAFWLDIKMASGVEQLAMVDMQTMGPVAGRFWCEVAEGITVVLNSIIWAECFLRGQHDDMLARMAGHVTGDVGEAANTYLKYQPLVSSVAQAAAALFEKDHIVQSNYMTSLGLILSGITEGLKLARKRGSRGKGIASFAFIVGAQL